MPVMNACNSVVTTCKYILPVTLLYYYFIPCPADPSWSFSLLALYSASRPYQLQTLHSASGLHH